MTCWEDHAFKTWIIDIAGGYVSDFNVQIGVWRKPYTKTITPAYTEIRRVKVKYSDNTTKAITPIVTDYATETEFLAEQGLSLDVSDPAWQAYLNG